MDTGETVSATGMSNETHVLLTGTQRFIVLRPGQSLCVEAIFLGDSPGWSARGPAAQFREAVT